MLRLCFFIFFISIQGFGYKCNAQVLNLEFQQYTQNEGLPSNETYFVFKDSKNFIWICTDQGVVKFSGSKFEKIKLTDNVVFKIKEDKYGRIWFFPKTGRLEYYENGVVKQFAHKKLQSFLLDDLLITNASITDDNKILINSASFKNFDVGFDGNVENFDFRTSAGGDTVKIKIRKVNSAVYFARLSHFSDTHTFLQIEIDGINKKYNIPTQTDYFQQYGCIKIKDDYFIFLGKSLIKLLPDGSHKIRGFRSNIFSIHSDDNSLWVAFQKDGAMLLDANMVDLNKEHFLKNLSITSIEKDEEGGLWFSTLEKGVFYNKSRNVVDINLQLENNKDVSQIYLYNKHLLFSTSNGIFVLKNEKIIDIKRFQNVKINYIFINKLKECIVTASGVFAQNNKDQISFEKIAKNPLDLSRFLIIQSTNGLYSNEENKYFYSQGYTFNEIKTSAQSAKYSFKSLDTLPFHPTFLFKAPNNNLWFGSKSETVKMNIDFASGELIKSGLSFPGNSTCMIAINKDYSVIGLRSEGLLLLKNGEVVEKIKARNGLLNNSVRTFHLDGNDLWVATSEGISVVTFHSLNPLNYTIKNFGRNFGLYNIIINQLISADDEIFVATNSGIKVIRNAQELLHAKPLKIPFYINGIHGNNQTFRNNKNITIPYKNNNIKISFTAICYNSPQELIYYYRIPGEDSLWSQTESASLLLNNLSPGNYKVELKCELPTQKRYSDTIRIDFTVAPPWWQNNWLRLLGILVIIGAAWLIARRKVINVRKEEQEKLTQQQRMTELEQTALRAQMNPHLIFNCLTSIQQLIVSGKNEEANDYLVQFSALIRKTLEFSSNPNITLRDEVNYLKDYLSLEELRLPDRFTYKFHIAPEIDAATTEIPHMMLQPILENSIRHGIKPLVNKMGSIDIHFKKDAEFITAIITDNGVGRAFSKAKKNILSEHKSFGLHILEKRLEGLGVFNGVKSSLEITDLKDADGVSIGTTVTLIFPYKKSKV